MLMKPNNQYYTDYEDYFDPQKKLFMWLTMPIKKLVQLISHFQFTNKSTVFVIFTYKKDYA